MAGVESKAPADGAAGAPDVGSHHDDLMKYLQDCFEDAEVVEHFLAVLAQFRDDNVVKPWLWIGSGSNSKSTLASLVNKVLGYNTRIVEHDMKSKDPIRKNTIYILAQLPSDSISEELLLKRVHITIFRGVWGPTGTHPCRDDLKVWIPKLVVPLYQLTMERPKQDTFEVPTPIRDYVRAQYKEKNHWQTFLTGRDHKSKADVNFCRIKVREWYHELYPGMCPPSRLEVRYTMRKLNEELEKSIAKLSRE